MKRGGGWLQRQTAVDRPPTSSWRQKATNNASDAGQLAGVLQAVRDNVEQRPRQALADTGYRSFRELDGCADRTGGGAGPESKRRLGFDRNAIRTPRRWPTSSRQAGKAENGNGSPNRPTAGSERVGIPAVQPAGAWARQSRWKARLYGAEPAQDEHVRHDGKGANLPPSGMRAARRPQQT